jgi:hypothetical protein
MQTIDDAHHYLSDVRRVPKTLAWGRTLSRARISQNLEKAATSNWSMALTQKISFTRSME